MERLAEKLVIKCMDEKAAALRESIGQVYEMADRGVESRYVTFSTTTNHITLISTDRSKQNRRVLLFDMLRLLLCMSRQPAIWKNRRQGLNKDRLKKKTNEEEKKKLDTYVDRDYETWREEFKNDTFEDELHFEKDDKEEEFKADNNQNDAENDMEEESGNTVNANKFKHLPPLARLPLEYNNNNILFDDTKDVHFHSSSHIRSVPSSTHRRKSNEFRATELQNRLRDSAEIRAAQKCGFAKDTSLVR